MADMDGTGQVNGLDEDPAAAFLAKEQDELADIVGDTLGFGTGDAEVSEPEASVLPWFSPTQIRHPQTGQEVPQQQDLGEFFTGDMGEEVRLHHK